MPHEFLPPQPITLPEPGPRYRARRLTETLGVAAKRLGPLAGRQVARRSTEHGTSARTLRLMFEELGATYVKFGQMIASAPGIVGQEMAEEFRSCLDSGPPVPFRLVRDTVEAHLGRPLESVYETFERRPFAAASMSVVHRATLPGGEVVAVKVLRPGVATKIAADLDLMEPFFTQLARQGVGQVLELVSYLLGLREQVSEELDLRNEMRSMAHFRLLFADFSLDELVIPKVYEELSGREVLTMEYLDGIAIDDLARVADLGAQPRPLVEALLRAWVLTALQAGVFHADIHAGNLLVLPGGRLGMLDWGIVARLDPDTYGMIKGLVSASLGDESVWESITGFIVRMQGTALQEGFGLTEEQIAHMIRAIIEPVLTQPVADVSMAALFSSSDDMVRIATGEAPVKRTLREKWRANRNIARANRTVLDNGYVGSEFRRQNFLAAKQLLYLERYARMYMPERAVLGDPAFLQAVMDTLAENGPPALNGVATGEW
ncbi:hypothetical protein AYO38_02385 [bacterium SCGC AG-212-C10]|nr:hypothetical protein AYO38_02385 [bacterium SCGC AG-212-C10]